MEKKIQELTDKIKNIEDIKLPEVQKDRDIIQEKFETELLSFFNNVVNRISSHNELKELVATTIKNRIIEDKGIEEIHVTHLMKFYEIVAKAENDASVGILNILKDMNLKKPSQEGSRNSKKDDIDKKTLETAKNILDIMDSIKKSEFNEKK